MTTLEQRQRELVVLLSYLNHTRLLVGLGAWLKSRFILENLTDRMELSRS